MEKIRLQFKEFSAKYRQRLSFFNQTADQWLNEEYVSDARELRALLNELKSIIVTLDQELAKDPSALNEKFAAEQFDRARTIYKEIHELTKPLWRQWLETILIVGSLAIFIRTFLFTLYYVPTGSAEGPAKYNILVGDHLWGNKMAYYLDEIKRGDLDIFDPPKFNYAPKNTISYFWQKYVGFPIPMLGLKEGPTCWVKRVIGIPGDTVEGRIEEGKPVIYLNGQKLDEFYKNPLPLIHARKTTGFLRNPIIPLLGWILKKETKRVNYTFDPSKPIDQQDFYNLYEYEVVKNPLTGKPILTYPDDYRPEDSFVSITLPKDKYWVMGDNRRNSGDSRAWGMLDRSLIKGRASFIVYSIDTEEFAWPFELLKHPIDFWTKKLRWWRTGNSLANPLPVGRQK